jgi:hypothetical protein
MIDPQSVDKAVGSVNNFSERQKPLALHEVQMVAKGPRKEIQNDV